MLRTARLILRRWRDSDRAPCAEMTSDPEVMRFFPVTRDRARSDAWIDRVEAHFERTGFGIWAVEAPGVAPFIGLVGLSEVPAEIPCAPAVEAAWTLHAPFWRHGYAAEAAAAAMQDGFERVGLAEIVAFTAALNTPSQAVMRALGMVRDVAGDFDHPRVPEGHELRPHVLFRRGREGADLSRGR
jgi:ribosomal-protein-alanine N-acetyltransferase